MLIENQLDRFTASMLREERSPATVEKYRREAAAFLRWLEGREPDGENAAAYKAALAEARSSAGLNGAIAALNCLAKALGLPWRLKSVRIQPPIFREEDRELTEAEYRRLLAAARKRKNERLLLVMEAICATGIRVSELRFFTVEAVRRGRAEVTNKGKTRTVLLPGKLQKVLLRYTRERGIAAGPVFVTRSGRPLDRSNIWHEMKNLCKAAGVAESKVFPHNLRHLFARAYYALEKDIVRLADILGHSSVNTTRIYTMESGYTHRKHLERLRLVE
jgi:integrase/recombinase XerD